MAQSIHAKELDLILQRCPVLFPCPVLLRRLPCCRAIKTGLSVVAGLITTIGYPEPLVELRKEEQVDDDDLEAKENHVESYLAVVPCRIGG